MKQRFLLTVLAGYLTAGSVWSIRPETMFRKPVETSQPLVTLTQGTQKPTYMQSAKSAMTSEEAIIYGNLVYRADVQSDEYGMYRMHATEGARPEALICSDFYFNGGGVWLSDDNTYIAGSYSVSPIGEILNPKLVTYNADTWEVMNIIDTEAYAMSWDLCYNPTDDKIYGSFPTDEYLSGVYFGTLDPVSGETQYLSSLNLPYAALVADGTGDMYGIEQQTGELYRISQNGVRVCIGNTGLLPRYYQSATFDYVTGNMYWLACMEDSSALYIVDTDNAALTLVNDLSDTLDEWVGIYSRTVYVNSNAPAAVGNLSTSFDAGSLEGTVSFTLPTQAYNGTLLDSTLDYQLLINNEVIEQGAAQPGERIINNVETEGGMTKFSVYASNSAGRGVKKAITEYIGFDCPVSPGNVILSGDDNVRIIEWDKVESGSHGGTIDTNNLTYRVVRFPDNIIVGDNLKECTFTDNELLEELAYYRYMVYASTHSGISDGAVSNGVILGTPVCPPYSSDFSSVESLYLYQTEDSNGDGACWTEYNDMGDTIFRYRFSEIKYQGGDDWLFSPPIYMEAGKVYNIRALTDCVNDPECIEVYVGQSPNASAMVSEVIAPVEVTPIEDFSIDPALLAHSGYFIAQNTGCHYVGFHAISDPGGFYLFLRSWEIGEAIDGKAPGKVDELTATAGAQGALNSIITFLAPIEDCVGNELLSLDKIIVTERVTGNLVGTVEAPTPGTLCTVADASPKAGLNYYDVTAVGDNGIGMTSTVKIWIGEDAPVPPTCVEWSLDSEGAHIRWQPVGNVGLHGGYVNTEEVTYTVMTIYPDFDFLVKNIHETECIDTSVLKISGRQQPIYYRVYARSSVGRSDLTTSNIASIGEAYRLPFAESFAGGITANYPWCTKYTDLGSSEATWALSAVSYDTPLLPADQDEGMLILDVLRGGETYITSPLIFFEEDSYPVVSFCASRSHQDANLVFMVSDDYCCNWNEYAPVEQTEIGEWVEKQYDLSEYAGRTVCIGFKASALPFAYDTAVDNILISNVSSVKAIYENKTMNVSVIGSMVKISNITGKVDIYNIGGYKTATVNCTPSATIDLQLGLYIARSDSGQTVKFTVR